MAYDQADTYETIELFRLTEKDAQLPIPQDDILKDSITRETFEALLGQLRGTGLDTEIEPFAHGLATILQRRKVALAKELDRTADKIGALAKCHDGSEFAETALEEAQARFLQLREIVGAIETMSEAAAECYEIETGQARAERRAGTTVDRGRPVAGGGTGRSQPRTARGSGDGARDPEPRPYSARHSAGTGRCSEGGR